MSTYDRILDVADDVFSRYGYQGARIDDIAQKVGIRRPSLFHHFRNKEALYQAVLDRWTERQAEHFRKTIGNLDIDDPVTELRLLIDATFNFLVDNRSYSYLTLHTVAANQIDEVPTEVATTSLDYWSKLLSRGRATGQFNDVTVGECMALVGGVVTFYVAFPDSRTEFLSEIGTVERDHLRTQLQRMANALILVE